MSKSRSGDGDDVGKSLSKEYFDVWRKVFHDSGRPTLKPPRWTDNDEKCPTAYINLKTLDIRVSQSFVECVSKKGMDKKRVVKGILQHEVEHHLTEPYDLETMLHGQLTLRSYKRRTMFQNLYADVVVNLHAIRLGRGDCIYELIEKTYDSTIMNEIYSFISRKLGLPSDNRPLKYPSLVDQLEWVDFYASTRQDRLKNLSLFAMILNQYKETTNISEDGDFNIKDFGEEEIKKTIKKMQMDEEISAEDATTLMEMNGISTSDVERYLTECSKYPLVIEPRPLTTDAGSYPLYQEPWSLDNSFSKIAPFSGFGIIAPGIVKQYHYQTIKTVGRKTQTPDCIIALDTSGSMDDHSINSYALIGVLSLAEQTILNEGRVAGINFSNTSLELGFTRDLFEVANFFYKYQGGETMLNTMVMRRIYEQCITPPDIHIITDTEVSNLDDVIHYLQSVKTRTHIWVIGGAKKSYEGINVYSVGCAEDIPKIVVGRRDG